MAIMSYNGRVNFGLLGDYDAMEDIEEIAGGIAKSLAELEEAARPRRARLSPPAARSTDPAAPVGRSGLGPPHRPTNRS